MLKSWQQKLWRLSITALFHTRTDKIVFAYEEAIAFLQSFKVYSYCFYLHKKIPSQL